MRRDLEDCPHRVVSASDGVASCSLVRRMLGDRLDVDPTVTVEACRRCCDYRLPGPSDLNPVAASLVYRAARQVIDRTGASWRDRDEALRAQRFVQDHLHLDSGPHASPAPAGRSTGFRWAAGVLTAPRPTPTIAETLRSLARAGFSDLHLFAEPGSWIPDEFAHLPRTRHGRRLGNVGNFHTTLTTLLFLEPEADAFVVFQDDVEAPPGLREWCEREFWPHSAGIVSLYTCGAQHDQSPGWRLLSPGLHHTLGGLGFVFRRSVLEEFLCDGRSFAFRRAKARTCDDGVLGEWVARRGASIAYHTPSLLGHTGTHSSLELDGHGIAGPLTTTRPARRLDEVDHWRPTTTGPGPICLVGWNTPSGLGYLNRDLASHLPVGAWLVPKHPELPELPPPPGVGCIDHVPRDLPTAAIKARLRGFDWLLFPEDPFLPNADGCARELGVQVACVPMWEYADLRKSWMFSTNLMICPTRFCHELFLDWKRRFGYGWEAVHVPWPVDTRRIPFRQRMRCERFLFVNGTGGRRALRPDGRPTPYHRKGIEIVAETARLLRPVPFVIVSQVDSPVPLPDNVTLRRPPIDNARLYDEGDVCVQPSHWEGLGLPLLECQAAGLPLVTTDAPPMNEFRPFRAVSASRNESVSVSPPHPLTAHCVGPEDLAAALEPLYRSDVADASLAARRFVEAEHSWPRALPLLIRALSR